jgi:hypothetical protein
LSFILLRTSAAITLLLLPLLHDRLIVPAASSLFLFTFSALLTAFFSLAALRALQQRRLHCNVQAAEKKARSFCFWCEVCWRSTAFATASEYCSLIVAWAISESPVLYVSIGERGLGFVSSFHITLKIIKNRALALSPFDLTMEVTANLTR